MIKLFSRSFKRIQNYAFVAMLLIVLAISLYMISPYGIAILWAAVLASIFYPLYERMQRYVPNKNWRAFIATTAVVLVVLLPVSLVVSALIREAVSVYEYVRTPETIEAITQFIENQRQNEFVSQYIEGVDIQARLESAIGTLGSSVLNFIRIGSISVFSFLAKSLIMLYTLFFLFRDGKELLLKLERLLPFGDKNERELYRRFTSTSQATLKGSVFLAIIQGLVAGVGFAIVGFPSAVFFSILVMFFSIIPALGASFVLVPAAIFLFFTGSVWQAFVLIGFAVLISTSENIIRPKLVGDGIRMHPGVFLLATVGGISLFGISGIVFGPVLISLLLSLFAIYEERFKSDLDKESQVRIVE